MNPQDKKIELDIEERFAALPEALQGLIVSDVLAKETQALGAQFALAPEATVALKNNIVLVLMLFKNRHELPGMLQENLEIPSEHAAALVAEINTRIFTHSPEIDMLLNEASAVIPETTTQMVAPAAASPTVSVATPAAPPQPETTQAERLAALQEADPTGQPVHGYGAYRAINPHSNPADSEPVVEATSQADVLERRPSLSQVPTYDDTNPPPTPR